MIRFLTAFAVRKVALYETLSEVSNLDDPPYYPFFSYFWLWLLKKISGGA